MSSTLDNVTVNLKSAEQFRISFADVKKTLSLIRVHIKRHNSNVCISIVYFHYCQGKSFNLTYKYGASVRSLWHKKHKIVAGGIMQTFCKVLQPSKCKQFLYCSCQHFNFMVIFDNKMLDSDGQRLKVADDWTTLFLGDIGHFERKVVGN